MNEHKVNKARLQEIEAEVTRYMVENFSFAVLRFDTKEDRLHYEECLLSTIYQCSDFSLSEIWLGKFHPTSEILKSCGLWNVQGLGGTALLLAEAISAARLLCKLNYRMTKTMRGSSRNVIQKRKPGRPPTGESPIASIRLSPALRAAVVAWAGKQLEQPNLSTAFRRLIELGLTVKGEPKPSVAAHLARRGKARKASDMAGRTIDALADKFRNDGRADKEEAQAH